jgi:single-strand DNA-binding protein
MARGMNRVMLIGFVGRDPEMRYTSNGQPVTTFSLSTNRRWTTSEGEARESSEWFNAVTWGSLAEAANASLRKDRRAYVEGHLQTRSWEDAEGQRQFRTEVIATRLILLGNPEPNGEPILPSMPVPPSQMSVPVPVPATQAQATEEMPLCLNRVMIIGNLGRDPEMRYTPGGQAVTSFNVAATRSWTTASGERRNSTEWFSVVAWGNLAEICNEYLTKGRRVYVEGELRTYGWEEPSGKKHFRTELVANEMIMLGPRPASLGTGLVPNLEEEESSL